MERADEAKPNIYNINMGTKVEGATFSVELCPDSSRAWVNLSQNAKALFMSESLLFDRFSP